MSGYSPVSNTSTGGSVSMGYENPAFRIRIVAPNDALQPPRGTNRQMGVTMGSPMSAIIDNVEITGKIIDIIKTKDGKDILYVIIVTGDGKRHKVDKSILDKTSTPFNIDATIKTSTPGIFAESRILSFENFVNEKYENKIKKHEEF